MNVTHAIALSAGSKARALSEKGRTVVVQERHQGVGEWWLHVWELTPGGGTETDIHFRETWKLKDIYAVDPDADYWIPV